MKIIFLKFLLVASFAAQAQSEVTKKDPSFTSNGNPIIRHKYTADPAAMVYKDKLYLYTGHDVAPPKDKRHVMHDWLCFSTSDMVHWTEHPSPLNTKAFKWAKESLGVQRHSQRNSRKQ